MSSKTTTKSRSPLLSMPTEMQTAYNTLAVAIKDYTANPGPETQKKMEDARQEVYRIEDLYREGRKLRLAHALDERDRTRRS